MEEYDTQRHGEDKDRRSSIVQVERDTAQLTQDLVEAFYLGTSNFLLAYNTRAGIGVLLRIFKLIQKRKFDSIIDLTKLLDEKHLSFRVEAVTLGLFAGWSTGGYRGLKVLVPFILKRLVHLSKNQLDHISTVVAGSIAACSIGFLNAQRRRSLALYALTRALQCAYNMAKQRQYWHFWGSTWLYGDSLLFALSSAQVMYAFIMRPLTLPHAYFRFIQQTGPVEREVLEMVRHINRQVPLDLEQVRMFMRKHRMTPNFPFPSRYPQQLPCRFIHPHSETCTSGIIYTFRRAFTRAFPLYLSLFIVPSVVLRFKRFVRQPIRTMVTAVMNATRSNAFVASFCTLYMAIICLQRRLMQTEHRFIYYMAGLGASITILIEPKHRRSELALYVLPRALDSLYMIMNDRRIFTGVRNGEILLFSLSMAWIMYGYEHEHESMNPFLHSSIKRFMQTSSEKTQQKKKKQIGVQSLELEPTLENI